MKRKLLTAVLMTATLALTACGGSGSKVENQTQPENTQVQTQAQESSYPDAESALAYVWSKVTDQFPAYGGNIAYSVADGAPAKIDVSDADFLTNTMLIPADLQASVTDGATLIHMMNANTYTSAAIKVSGISAADAATKIKDTFLSTQFICGIPDKLVAVTSGDYVVYAFGAEDLINEFKTNASTLENANVVVEQYFN